MPPSIREDARAFYERHPYPPPNHADRFNRKALFDTIGNCIGGLVEKTLSSSQAKSPLHMARTGFENLWWFDQVVFDASRCRARKEEA
jgi:hypothetical protein